VLAAAAAVGWLGRATGAGLLSAAAGALAGTFAGHRLAATRLRLWFVPAVIAAAAAALLTLLRVLALLPVPGGNPWPEAAAGVRDAGFLAVLSAAAAALLAFLGGRVRLLRVLPLAALVLATAALLAPHRGGAINRPQELADLAWLRGWHPALLLTLAGTAAALVAGAALLRRPGRYRALLAACAALLLAVLVLAAVPSFGLLQVPLKDPLGLSGKPRTEGESGTGSRSARAGDPRRGNPLGLESPHGGGRSQPEMVPFQDDYSSDSSQVPVAVVVLRDDVNPAGGMLYFRQLAFSSFNGRRLVRSFVSGVDADLFDGFGQTTPAAATPAVAGLREDVPATMSLLRDHVQPPVLADGVRLTPEQNPDPALFRRTYSTQSRVLVAPAESLFGRRAGDPAWTPEVRQAYLEVPPDPRYRELADSIADRLRPEWRGDPWARAIGIALWLQENTLYSMRSRHAAAEDPTASYLFGDRIGYCVHLSHATAYLARALGLPARVAAGYAYTAADRENGSALLIRSGDAHAWAEIHLEGVGWVPLDPSPPSLDPPMASPDMDLQRLLGEMARPKSNLPGEPPRPSYRWPSPAQVAAALLLFGLVVAVIGFAVKGFRRAAPRFARRDGAALAAYRASLDRLGECGLYRAEGETREAFAARAAAVSPAFGRLTGLHLAARFGRRPADAALAHRLTREVAREIRNRAGLRRRIGGLLAPYRWLRST
jgi:transglutaminase-like putative cysteine protease